MALGEVVNPMASAKDLVMGEEGARPANLSISSTPPLETAAMNENAGASKLSVQAQVAPLVPGLKKKKKTTMISLME